MSVSNESYLSVHHSKIHPVLKALSNEARFEILRLLYSKPMNISDLARALGITQPTATTYVKQLEEAGLVITQLQKSVNGYTKICQTPYEGVFISWQDSDNEVQETAYELDMPVGHYSSIDCGKPSLLATQAGIIASSEDFSRFFHPIRMDAELLQVTQGRVSYLFPYNIPEAHRLISIELSTELSIASMSPEAAVDVILVLNHLKFGPFRLTAGRSYETDRHRPGWYPRELPPSGELYVWRMDGRQIKLNERHLGELSFAELNLLPMQPIEVTFMVASASEVCAGMILFGKSFGIYNQDIRLTIVYEPEDKIDRGTHNEK